MTNIYGTATHLFWAERLRSWAGGERESESIGRSNVRHVFYTDFDTFFFLRLSDVFLEIVSQTLSMTHELKPKHSLMLITGKSCGLSSLIQPADYFYPLENTTVYN